MVHNLIILRHLNLHNLNVPLRLELSIKGEVPRFTNG